MAFKENTFLYQEIRLMEFSKLCHCALQNKLNPLPILLCSFSITSDSSTRNNQIS